MARMKVYSFKAPEPLMQQVRGTLKRFVHTRRQAPLNESEFIRRAIEHELDHLRRGAACKRRGVGITR
jgi:hypothetical protein